MSSGKPSVLVTDRFCRAQGILEGVIGSIGTPGVNPGLLLFGNIVFALLVATLLGLVGRCVWFVI